VPLALGDERLRIVRVAQEHDNAVVVGAAVRVRRQRLDQQRIVALVGTRLACVSRRPDSRGTAQRLGADAGVVRERRKARRARGVARLGEGILDERGERLVRIRNGELALGHGLDADGLEQGGELPELAAIGTRENQTAHAAYRGVFSASRCAAARDPMPCAARSIIRSRSARVNAAPSAVP